MDLMRWSPLNATEGLFDEFPSMYPRLGWDVAVDVYEKDNNVIAEMQVPGIDPARLDVAIKDNVLHVSGDREEVKEERGKQYYRQEISRGSFSRHVRLPSAVDADTTRATYRDGMLTIEAPKLQKEEERPKKIPVQSNEGKGEREKAGRESGRDVPVGAR